MPTASVEERRWAAWWLTLALLAACPVTAAADGQPDSDFLEYLGSWEDGDEDWVAISQWQVEADGDGEAKQGKDEEDESES